MIGSAKFESSAAKSPHLEPVSTEKQQYHEMYDDIEKWRVRCPYHVTTCVLLNTAPISTRIFVSSI